MEQKLGWSRVANAPDGNTKEAKTTRAVSPKPAGGKGARKKSAAKRTTTKQRVGNLKQYANFKGGTGQLPMFFLP